MLDLTKRQQVVLAALAAQPAATFAPVQVQKLFFLLDRNIPEEFGGAQFSFTPYDYGPFDRNVYAELDYLAAKGYVAVSATAGARKREYSLTAAGYTVGTEALATLKQRARDYIAAVSTWVRGMSFAELVGAIYKKYPDMRVNSVFRD